MYEREKLFDNFTIVLTYNILTMWLNEIKVISDYNLQYTLGLFNK